MMPSGTAWRSDSADTSGRRAEAEKIAQRCAADNADHLAFLLPLLELELIERERKAAERRLKAARFPHRCHILETKGENYRLQDAKRRRRRSD